MLRLSVLLGVVLLAIPPGTRAEDASLPIRRVVLYKHGIGYFERQGPVSGRAEVSLRFRQDQMSDVLKTLTVLDRGGGRIGAIAYDSQKPPERLLAEFAFVLRCDNVQQSLVQQLRGARIRADVAGRGEVRGAVLGLDMRVEQRDGVQVQTPRLAVLTDEGEIVSADLFDLHVMRFEDEALVKEMQRCLDVLRSMHRRDEKSVSLVCEGEGEREVFVSYAVEQPVWKASYRLVLLGTEKLPFLQGWAVVDNASDEDWNEVTLSLVAGLPISFRQDLYTPQYRERPLLEVDEKAAVSVDEFAGAEYAKAPRGPITGAGGRVYRGPGSSGPGTGGPSSPGGGLDLMEHQEAEAVTREIGDLLEYRIDHAVTIPRNRSALLPIVSASVEGGKVALYNEAARAANPMAAVHLHNTTGLTLEGGPVTVLEEETYAGEALLGSIKPDEKRYVPYAVDLGLKASTKFDTETERVHKVTILRGTMLTHYQQVEQKTYTFDNKNPEARTVVIEHSRRPGYELRRPENAADSEIDCYRFRLDVGGGQTTALSVIETREQAYMYELTDIDADTIAVFLESRVLNEAAEKALRQVVEMKARVQEAKQSLAERQQRLADIDKNQARIRKNLEALGASVEEKDLRKAYVEQLAADEQAVKALAGEVKELQRQALSREAELDALLQSFALEYSP
ncbi:MAG: hypothetical protein HY812_09300 [Planctomycetes bacterium]|nr:hypothetical protein [Planctomycetota bacterium]